MFHLHQPVKAIEYLIKALAIKQSITVDANKDKCIAATLHHIGKCYISLENFNDALNFLTRLLHNLQNATLNKDTHNIWKLLYLIEYFHNRMQNYNVALTVLSRSHQIVTNTRLNSNANCDNIAILLEISHSHNHLQNYNKALSLFNRALQIAHNVTLNALSDKDIA